MRIRVAEQQDLAQHARALLSSAEPPTLGVAEDPDAFVVADYAAVMVAVGGIDIHGSCGRLRSLVVVA